MPWRTISCLASGQIKPKTAPTLQYARYGHHCDHGEMPLKVRGRFWPAQAGVLALQYGAERAASVRHLFLRPIPKGIVTKTVQEFAMPLTKIRCLIAAAAGIFLALPAWGAEDGLQPSPPPEKPAAASPAGASGEDQGQAPNAEGRDEAQALINAGRFTEALNILVPLVKGDVVEADTLFLYGLAAIEASQQPDISDEPRDALLDEAIGAFHAMLVKEPGLVRVRLELARAFFLKGEDALARRHFEHVLAGKPPAGVVLNVNRFLAQMRARKRWSTYVGFALAPDTNIGGGSDERTIYIGGLPFQRDADELTTSGVGISVWGGGEYQYPLGERLRLRAGGDVSRREYKGGEFDQDVRGGARGAALACGQEHGGEPAWEACSGAGTATIGTSTPSAFGRRPVTGLPGGLTAHARVSWHDRDYRRDFLDGPVVDASLSGSWVVTSDRARRSRELAGGASAPEAERWRHERWWVRAGASVLLPWGFTCGRQRRAEVDGLRGQLVPAHRRRGARGPHPLAQGLCAPPRLHPVRLQPAGGAGARGAQDQRPALRLQAFRRRAALRAPVLGSVSDGDARCSSSSPQTCQVCAKFGRHNCGGAINHRNRARFSIPNWRDFFHFGTTAR